MWIKGHDVLVNTDSINTVYVSEHQKEYYLMTFCSPSGGGTVDLYESEQDANAAKDWFYLLLTGEIDKDDWEQGRTDAEARERIVELKENYEHGHGQFYRFYALMDMTNYYKELHAREVENLEQYLANMFEKATGVKYDHE